jgi:hypothetical protein
MKDICKFKGEFTLRVYKDQEAKNRGEVLKEVKVKNKMTTASLAAISGLVGATGSQTAFTYLAVGTDSTAVSASHTGLIAEIVDHGLARAAATISRTTTTQTNDTLLLEYQWTVSGSATFPTINEIGVFNASSSGVMLARALTNAITTASGNVIGGGYKWITVGN